MPIRQYRFCPQCSDELHVGTDGDAPYKGCDACDVRFYDEPKVAVVAMVFRDNSILLVKRANEPETGSWCLPGGFMNVSETPQDAVAREVAEECGVQIDNLKLVEVFPMCAGRLTIGVVIAFAAELTDELEQPRAGDDASEVKWFQRGKLPDKIAFESNRHLLHTWSRAGGNALANPLDSSQ